MSKIGKKPIILSESQKIDIIKLNDENFEIKGPKGVLNFVLPEVLS
jgi:ribosomal protein L6P/L9E